jgi:hypothetical protein
MVEHLNSSPEENTRSLKLILLIVNDAKVGPFLVRVIKRETTHHVILASHEHQALKMIQEIKTRSFAS